jgi:hypothetical protein
MQFEINRPIVVEICAARLRRGGGEYSPQEIGRMLYSPDLPEKSPKKKKPGLYQSPPPKPFNLREADFVQLSQILEVRYEALERAKVAPMSIIRDEQELRLKLKPEPPPGYVMMENGEVVEKVSGSFPLLTRVMNLLFRHKP